MRDYLMTLVVATLCAALLQWTARADAPPPIGVHAGAAQDEPGPPPPHARGEAPAMTVH